ncbi:MAG: hypothetical protein ACE5D7_06040, partial [Fidelibacterota bacterium]
MEKYLLVFSIISFLFSTGNEVEITLVNKPPGNITISAFAEGTVYGINFLPTSSYNGDTINTEFNVVRFDFITTPNSSEIIFGYGKYKIEIDGDYVYVDMRDCNYPYTDNSDLYFSYDFNTNHFNYNGNNVTGGTVGIWLILGTEEHEIDCFLPHIVFSNKLNDVDLGGTLMVNESIEVLSGNDLPLAENSENFVRTKNKVIDYSSLKYEHHHWNNDIDNILYQNSFTADYLLEEISKFKQVVNLTINSQVPDIILLRDPWYAYQDNGTWIQPDEFRPLSEQDDDNGNMQVFLNQNLEFNDTDPIYHLKALPFYVTTYAIYEFSQWYAENAIFDVNGSTSTSNFETPIVFISTGATVEAQYNQINNSVGSYTVGENEILRIPPEADITFTDGFQLNVSGELLNEPNETGDKSVINFSNNSWIKKNINGILNLTDILFYSPTSTTGIKLHYMDDLSSTYSRFTGCIFENVNINIDAASQNQNTVQHTSYFTNCTLINGDTYFVVDEGSYHDLDFMNTILFNSDIDNVIRNLSSDILVRYCTIYNSDIQSGAMISNSIYDDPDFVSSSDYHLLSDSPCIDAGNPNFQLDPDGSVKDIGAYYFDAVPPVPANLTKSGGFGDHPTLTWDPVTVADFNHYVLKTEYNGPNNSFTDYVSLTETSYTDLAFTIEKFGSDVATYSVCSVDWAQQWSDFSNEQNV